MSTKREMADELIAGAKAKAVKESERGLQAPERNTAAA